MKAHTENVFVIREDSLDYLPAHTMRKGLFGRNLEDALQTLIEKYPEVIPGNLIEPGAEDPPHFILLRREMSVGGWSLDHLLVDQRGVLTLVEAKLIQNPESRRDVVGQIMEYAANAVDLWTCESVKETAGEYWAQRGKDLGDVIRTAFGNEIDLDEFWGSVEENLKKGRVRLIIAADSIRPAVRRIIEYLNSEMSNAEVLGLELKCYGDESDLLILAPQLIGQTQSTVDRKSGTRQMRKWNPDELRFAYQEMDDVDIGKRLVKVLDWAERNNFFLDTTSSGPAFGLRGRSGDRIMSFFVDGVIYGYIADTYYEGGSEERDELVSQLKSMDLIDPRLNPDEVVSGRNLIRKIDELSEEDLEELLNRLEPFCSGS